jgi:hypothetical protein
LGTSYETISISQNTSIPTLLASAGDPPCLIYNTSTNPIWLSDSQSFTPGGSGVSNSVELPGLAFLVLSNLVDTYAVSIQGPAQISIIPGGLNFFQLAEIITKILIISAAATHWLFEYNGTPGVGNPPILWAVPPGSTQDPYTNALPVSGGIATEVAGGGLLAQLYDGMVLFDDEDAPSSTHWPGTIGILHVATSFDDPIMAFNSPAFDANNTKTTLWLLGYAETGSAPPAQIIMFSANDIPDAVNVTLVVCGTIQFGALGGSPLYPQINGALLEGQSGYLQVTSPDTIIYGTQRWTEIVGTSTISTVNPSYQNIGPAISVAVDGKMYIHIVYSEAAAGTPRFKLNIIAGTFTTTYLTGKWQANNLSSSFGGISSAAGPVAGPTMTGIDQILDLECEFVVSSSSGSVQLQANTSAGADDFDILACDIRWEPV